MQQTWTAYWEPGSWYARWLVASKAKHRVLKGLSANVKDNIFENRPIGITMKEKELAEQVEQLRVQLAGCLTAADGATSNPAKQGMYGWSPAYQAVLDLRIKYDKLDLERVDRLLAAALKIEEKWHRVMDLLRRTKMKHGACKPRSRRACTRCNAQEEIDLLISEYKARNRRREKS